ncbi:MAG: hypothetical protein JW982_04270 [Spirochaetes bacterium]|nr:hypothetical protein [Spirochaetota bacterium]
MGKIEEFIIDSESLKSNCIGENTMQKNAIYLPASYSVSDRFYPTVYFLHGFSQSYRQIYRLKKILDRFMMEKKREFIFVSVNGNNKFGGSFWADSPVTGNWTDYFINEVIPYVDSEYRTLKSEYSRSISGFSMGAGAAISLLMKHPEIFQTGYALCPGVLGNRDLRKSAASWAHSVLQAYAASFSPDVTMEFPHGRIPQWDGTEKDNRVINCWLDAFPGSMKRISDFKAKGRNFKALQIDYAINDEYTWLIEGVKSLSEIFHSEGISHTLNAMDIEHEINHSVAENSMLVFLADNMRFSGE